MTPRYNAPMRQGQCPLPAIWLISDARNDASLEIALRRLPRGSGFVYRHYHLPADLRRARFEPLLRLCRARGHVVILAGDPAKARRWGADGHYGPVRPHASQAGLYLASAHDLREIAAANRARANAVLISPVHPTRSHPGAATLGPVRFRLLARRAAMPVIALGGMNAHRARTLGWPRFAAIDGLALPLPA
jgi:thiamine-phosphate pyrophosphorylase